MCITYGANFNILECNPACDHGTCDRDTFSCICEDKFEGPACNNPSEFTVYVYYSMHNIMHYRGLSLNRLLSIYLDKLRTSICWQNNYNV